MLIWQAMIEASNQMLSALEELIGADAIYSDPDSLSRYAQDAGCSALCQPLAVIFPEKLETVQAIVQFANQHRLALVPSGGRTGLSGGATTRLSHSLVVSFERMHCIDQFDPIANTVRCQVGVITQQLHAFAESKNLYFPVDFASSGSSQIGGNIATNAGGIKVIRYGMMRQWVAGMTVVTGNGEILRLDRNLLKDNAGYDLKQLFIGSEGTLGFIVDATLRLTQVPVLSAVMVVGFENLENVLPVFQVFKSALTLSAFEFFSHKALEKLLSQRSLSPPFATPAKHYGLIEFDAADEVVSALAMDVFSECLEKGWLVDGVRSNSVAQQKALWELREGISDALSHERPFKSDVSAPVARIPEFMQAIEKLLAKEFPACSAIWFGHLGDGNLHLNIIKSSEASGSDFSGNIDALAHQISRCIQQFGGSVSAEHGIGLLKKPLLHYCRSESEIDYMRQIKRVFDPNGVMNPGKIFD